MCHLAYKSGLKQRKHKKMKTKQLTFKDVDPDGTKSNAVYNYYTTRSKSELASLIISLLYPADLAHEYRELPKEFKKKYPHTASKEK
jgi:aldehyde:ferredoxin oxidoreductase